MCVFLPFQLQCCGVNNYEDFSKAIEFQKYVREEGDGQVIPESCCILDESPQAKELFIAKDRNCLTTPTVSNSFMDQVNSLLSFLEDRDLE